MRWFLGGRGIVIPSLEFDVGWDGIALCTIILLVIVLAYRAGKNSKSNKISDSETDITKKNSKSISIFLSNNTPVMLLTLIIAGIFITLLFFVYSDSTEPSGIENFATNAMSFITAAMVSFMFTQYSSELQNKRETEKLGHLAMQRMALQEAKAKELYLQVNEFNSLSDSSFEVLRQRNELYLFAVQSLASDLRASVSEISSIANLSHDLPDTLPSQGPVSNVLKKARETRKEPVQQVKPKCPACGTEDAVELKMVRSATKRYQCSGCSEHLIVHRTGDFPAHYIVDYNLQSRKELRDCPNQECDNGIKIDLDKNKKQQYKTCLECCSFLKYDRSEDELIIVQRLERKDIPEGSSCKKCPHCSQSFETKPPLILQDNDGRRHYICFSCKNITRFHSEEIGSIQ